MSGLPGTRADMPMMPMPMYPNNPGYIQGTGAENPHMTKAPAVQAGRAMHAAHMPTATISATAQEPLQLVSPDSHGKGSGEHGAADSGEVVDPNRLKFWNTEETVELIQLYKKYLPDFHKFGQRKMNVWQRVTEEMVSKGYSNFSWAECSAKFRSLRDSYRRMTTGDRAQTWQFYPLMKEVMKMEKMILEQEPVARPQKGTITCENDIRAASVPFPNPSVTGTGVGGGATVSGASLANVAVPGASQPSTSHSKEGRADLPPPDADNLARKRLTHDAAGPAVAKKSRDTSEQEADIVIGKNFHGETVKAKTKKPLGPMGVLGSLQALGRSLSLPQSQLVVGDDGQVMQTTSAPTGLFVNDQGQLCHSQPAAVRQPTSMPQWFKMYEKRTRAENTRRLEELKEMHRESLELQRHTLEVAKQKNELLKNLMESLAEFKALMQR